MKERNNIKISLIIPVFNIEKYVYKCLCSVVEQTKMPDEVIIIDDCSQDKTSIICDEFSKKYSFIKTIHLTQNGGVSKARNVGIEVSNGKYLLFIDGDDILSKYYVEKILDNIEKFKADLLIGNYTTAENYLDQFENCCIKNNINNIELVNLSDSVTTMYPMLNDNFEEIASAVKINGSTQNITYSADSKYTSSMILSGIKAALDKAVVTDSK